VTDQPAHGVDWFLIAALLFDHGSVVDSGFGDGESGSAILRRRQARGEE
jgi:hypothetical protein